MADGRAALAHQFDDLEQQYGASMLGMWIFLITEIMLFGGLFTAYTFLRIAYPAAFAAASGHNNVVIGTVNTVVLLTSSLSMALAVEAVRRERRKAAVVLLVITMSLGTVFLGFKALEYVQHWQEALVPGFRFGDAGHAPATALFFWLYFVMTGLHALHMVAGVALVAVMAALTWRRRFSARYHTPVEITGLYWHLVDVIWVFLFPLLYLLGRHGAG